MAHSTHGRHRAPGRHNPVSELSVIATRAGVSGAKASAVLAASGGLVAAFALPASAAPDTAAKVTTSVPATPIAAPAAPAISAPAVSTPVKAEVVGVTGVTVVAKPKPKPKPRPVVVREETTEIRPAAAERSSQRSNQRSTASSTRSAKSASRSVARKPVTQNVAQSASGVVNIARSLLGIAYVYGGTTPAGFDCSGFTQYVFRKAGVSIPRTASAQQAAATPVSSPRPGDLVFMGSPAWHVGIYTGDGKFIDSPRTGKFSSERAIWQTPTGYGRF
ncbi:C40 family peptidase [Knoellia sp. S7-12]|uniref:C40 family peptidase n=1 Tax=Knoellia sp. S7-12 TaxID=3126698 RepID=UPI0033680BF6